MRSAEELSNSAMAVINKSIATPYMIVRKGPRYLSTTPDYMLPLFSGGHDSFCATHIASRHPMFDGRVNHIRTGIGSKLTFEFVRSVCREFRWELVVWDSPATYEKFVRKLGFPGPGSHGWVYNWIKDRCIQQMTRGKRVALITGCRSQESVRRMGHVEPLKIGDIRNVKGVPTVCFPNRWWVAPCHDWSTEEQKCYMDEHDLPRNPVKIALGMSGECFCGAFAAPGEIDRIRRHCPDVAAEIDRLTRLAKRNGTPSEWGKRPKGQKGIVKSPTGPLCTSCDIRATHAGIVLTDLSTCPVHVNKDFQGNPLDT